MSFKSPTGADLPTAFVGRRARRALWGGIDIQIVGKAMPPADDASIRALGAGTIPMHSREGVSFHSLGSGIVTGGTAGYAIWREDRLAPRGAVTLLDAWRVQDDGEPVRIVNPDPCGPEPVTVIANIGVRDAGDWEDELLVEFAPYASPTPVAPATVRAQPQEIAELPTEPTLELEALARSMTEVPAAVSVSKPEVPALSGSSLEDAKRLFALTAAQLANLFGVTERQLRRYLADGEIPFNRQRTADALVAVGLTVVGGLGPQGARDWLYSGTPTGAQLVRDGRIEDLARRAEELRDSPFT